MKELGTWSTCDDVRQALSATNRTLANSTAIVTGSSSGIGVETAKQLAYLGATVVLACRNLAKTEEVISAIKADEGKAKYGLTESDLKLVALELDLSSLKSVKGFVEKFAAKVKVGDFPKLRLLVLNAGVFLFNLSSYTKDGFESTFGTNHLGHFYLTTLLLSNTSLALNSNNNNNNDKLRVVVVSSESHYGPVATKSITSQSELLSKVVLYSEPQLNKDRKVNPRSGIYDGVKAYGSSKLCNVLFAKQLSTLYGNKVTALSLHPGTMISTDISRENGFMNFVMKYVTSYFTKNIDQGTSTTLYCSLISDKEIQEKGLNGKFFSNCKYKKESNLVSPEAAEVLWTLSEELIRNYAKL